MTESRNETHATVNKVEDSATQAERTRMLGQLTAGIAHDFNNLLTAILGSADTVLSRQVLDPDVAIEVSLIRQNAERGAELVRSLLAFGQPGPSLPRLIAVNRALTSFAASARRLLGRGIRVDLVLDEPDSLIQMEPVHLDQVLMNLAVNAAHAMPGGGVVTIRARRRVLDQPEPGDPTAARAPASSLPDTSAASISFSPIPPQDIPPGRYVEIEVIDEGSGIPPDVLPRIFEPYFTTRRGTGGTGLGLSTVLSLVQQSGGFMATRSAPGEGTVVWLLFPARDGEIPEAPADPAPLSGIKGAGTKSMESARIGTVLLVEDDVSVRRVAHRALADAGWRVLAAESGPAALALLPRPPRRLDLVISDVALPGMNGTALLGDIRKILPKTPAILVSGYTESALQGDLPTDGVVFLPKPYRMRELLDAAARLVAASPRK